MSRIQLYRTAPFFFPLGWVDPGLICSILARARSIFLMMSSTVAVQMNGLGFSFQACINASIACFRSGTLTKLPRRIAFSVTSRNQRSTVDGGGKRGQNSGGLVTFHSALSLLEGVFSQNGPQRSRAHRCCAAKRTLHGEDGSEILDKRERGGPKWTAKMAQSLTASYTPPNSANWNWSAQSGIQSGDASSATLARAALCACRSCPSLVVCIINR